MNPTDPVAPTAAGNEPNSSADYHTVLVVDDSAMDRRLAGAIIQKAEGWKPVFAGNGVEALDLIPRVSPDVVLTDMLMPQMDGLELVEAVRAKYPLTPVILMTAHGSEDLAIRALQEGRRQLRPQAEPGPEPRRNARSGLLGRPDQGERAAHPRHRHARRDAL